MACTEMHKWLGFAYRLILRELYFILPHSPYIELDNTDQALDLNYILEINFLNLSLCSSSLIKPSNPMVSNFKTSKG
jgi:hypothetical protein